MRDSGILSNETAALPQQHRQFGQGKALSDAGALGRQSRAQALQTCSFRLSSDQKKVMISVVHQALEQLSPFGFRPVLSFAPAARMQRKQGARGSRPLSTSYRQPGHRVSI